MKIGILVVLLLSANFYFAQVQINPSLKKQLDSVGVLDQKYRSVLITLTTSEKVNEAARLYQQNPKQVVNYLSALQGKADSSNIIFMESVFAKYGYPGKTLVGEGTNEVAWFVVQHSQKIEKYLPLIKQAGEAGEITQIRVAMMEDRFLMYQGKEQIYGTQVIFKTLTDGTSGNIIFPIKDPEHVNERRKKMGFETTIEAFAQSRGIVYRVLQLSDVKQ